MPEINFFWDPLSDNILQERDESGAVTAEYTTEPGLYGNVISQNRGGVESQFHYDALGSNLAVTDDNQNVTDTFAYAAFGEVTERTGTTEVPFQYIGQKGYYTCGLSAHIMARRRPYEPVQGRWLAEDPMGPSVRELSLYLYVKNRATILIDPSGLFIVGCRCGYAQGEHYLNLTYRNVWIESSTPGGVDCLSVCQTAAEPPLNLVKDATPLGLSPWKLAPLIAFCSTMTKCPKCSIPDCEKYVAAILSAKGKADAEAIGTLDGWLEERGLGKYGGRCHLWTGTFLDDIDRLIKKKPYASSQSKGCVRGPINVIIKLDRTQAQWEDHSISWIRNECTGKCLVLDDGFWGSLGSVYDPCTVSPPLMSVEGQSDWNAVLASCGCPAVGPGKGRTGVGSI